MVNVIVCGMCKVPKTLNTIGKCLKALVGEVYKNSSKISFENSSHTHHIVHMHGGHHHHC